MQGYRDPARIREDVRKIAEQAAVRAQGVLAPEAYYRRVGVAACEAGTLTLETGAVFHSEEFPKLLSGCKEVIVFVLTLGSELDSETDSLMNGDDIVEALFMEMAGWYAVEKATKHLARHLWSIIEDEGCRLSRRVAPGYHDWPLQEQTGLFELFEGVSLPVRLLDSSVMLPKKSRSGLYGLRPEA